MQNWWSFPEVSFIFTSNYTRGFIPNSDIRDYVFVKVWLLNIWRHLLLAQVIPNYKKCFAWKILLWFVQVHEVSQSGIYHNNFLTCYLNPFLIKATFAFTVDFLWGIQVLDRSVLQIWKQLLDVISDSRRTQVIIGVSVLLVNSTLYKRIHRNCSQTLSLYIEGSLR